MHKRPGSSHVRKALLVSEGGKIEEGKVKILPKCILEWLFIQSFRFHRDVSFTKGECAFILCCILSVWKSTQYILVA